MYSMVVIGYSAGGMPLVSGLLQGLPRDYQLPIAIATHLPGGQRCALARVLSDATRRPVRMAVDKDPIVDGRIYIAPPDYHLLIDRDPEARPAFALSVDAPVKSVRPSIDVLFQSAAEVFEAGLIAVLLSGANSDGVAGIACVKELGGLCIVLDPASCEFNTLPAAVVKQVDVDYVASIEEIAGLLSSVQEPP